MLDFLETCIYKASTKEKRYIMSGGPTGTDKDLQARFFQLRGSGVSTIVGKPTNVSSDDLAARFLKFNNSRIVAVNVQNPQLKEDGERGEVQGAEDQKTVEELLAELGPEEQWTLNAEEPMDIAKLIAEARKATADTGHEREVEAEVHDTAFPEPDNYADVANELRTEAEGEATNTVTAANSLCTEVLRPNEVDSAINQDESQRTDDEEAEKTLQRILDELTINGGDIGDSSDQLPEQQPQTPRDKRITHSSSLEKADEEADDAPTLELPSTPNDLPSLPSSMPRDSHDADDADGLQLPSVPTSKPTRKSKTISNLPKYTNEDIESWCCICNDDATVHCMGCDGDLYCAKCWREGHTGPDVGYEERRHRWTKYVKPR